MRNTDVGLIGHLKDLGLFLEEGKLLRPRPCSRLAGAPLNPALSDSKTRGTLSLPKRKLVSDGCTEGQRKDPPDKGTVSVKPGSALAQRG